MYEEEPPPPGYDAAVGQQQPQPQQQPSSKALNLKNCILSCIATKNMSDRTSNFVRYRSNQDKVELERVRDNDIRNTLQEILAMPDLSRLTVARTLLNNTIGAISSGVNWSAGQTVADPTIIGAPARGTSRWWGHAGKYHKSRHYGKRSNSKRSNKKTKKHQLK